MLELGCTCMTYDEVLKTSGHVEKFSDYMVKDAKKGHCHRADKLIEEAMEKLIKKKNVKPEDKAKYEKIQQDCENYDGE